MRNIGEKNVGDFENSKKGLLDIFYVEHQWPSDFINVHTFVFDSTVYNPAEIEVNL